MRVRFRDVVVPAIGEDVLPRVLRKLGLYDDVAGNMAVCYICGEPLSLDTIGAIAMLNDKPVLICNKSSCIGKAALLISKSQSSTTPKVS
ncbi:MAG: hypothetical protein NDF51_01580 [archaeon YNP-WB-040]|jgi:hypothetical protein|nr:hypothetical protein [Candidatus Culexarchaeum yellowstonense]